MKLMAGAGLRRLVTLCAAASLLSGCASPAAGEALEGMPYAEQKALASALLTGREALAAAPPEDSGTLETAEETGTEEDSRELLESLLELPGRKDEETKDMLGGGEENWTEDRSFYIGRIYEAGLYGEDCRIFTSCDDDSDKTVESVSVWIISGERDVTEEATQFWTAELSKIMDSDPLYQCQSVESGARSWKWIRGDMAASMHQMKDILTIAFQPAVGELH